MSDQHHERETKIKQRIKKGVLLTAMSVWFPTCCERYMKRLNLGNLFLPPNSVLSCNLKDMDDGHLIIIFTEIASILPAILLDAYIEFPLLVIAEPKSS